MCAKVFDSTVIGGAGTARDCKWPPAASRTIPADSGIYLHRAVRLRTHWRVRSWVDMKSSQSGDVPFTRPDPLVRSAPVSQRGY
jgi:hypothetical protein